MLTIEVGSGDPAVRAVRVGIRLQVPVAKVICRQKIRLVYYKLAIIYVCWLAGRIAQSCSTCEDKENIWSLRLSYVESQGKQQRSPPLHGSYIICRVWQVHAHVVRGAGLPSCLQLLSIHELI